MVTAVLQQERRVVWEQSLEAAAREWGFTVSMPMHGVLLPDQVSQRGTPLSPMEVGIRQTRVPGVSVSMIIAPTG